jgi:hypothetical protein
VTVDGTALGDDDEWLFRKETSALIDISLRKQAESFLRREAELEGWMVDYEKLVGEGWIVEVDGQLLLDSSSSCLNAALRFAPFLRTNAMAMYCGGQVSVSWF